MSHQIHNSKFSKLGLKKQTCGQTSNQISQFFQSQSTSSNKSISNSIECCSSVRTLCSNPELNNNHEKSLETNESSQKSIELTTNNNCNKRKLTNDIDNTLNYKKTNSGVDSVILNESTGLQDFETPKKITKSLNRIKLVKPRVTKSKNIRKSSKKQSDIRNVFNNQYKFSNEYVFTHLLTQHSNAESIDPDQLQLALALSRSMNECQPNDMETCMDNELENVIDSVSNNVIEDYTKENNKKIKTTLEKFGFKSCLSKKEPDSYFELNAVAKNTKRIKCFTTLTRRNFAVQQQKIIENIKYILNENHSVNITNSTCTPIESFQLSNNPNLKQFINIDLRIYKLNSEMIDDNQQNFDKYYTSNICSRSNIPCGYLLKDWDCIPGRDSTPERQIVRDTTNVYSSSNRILSDIDCEEKTKDIPVTNQNILVPGTPDSINHNDDSDDDDETTILVSKKEIDRYLNTSPDLFSNDEAHNFNPQQSDSINIKTSPINPDCPIKHTISSDIELNSNLLNLTLIEKLNEVQPKIVLKTNDIIEILSDESSQDSETETTKALTNSTDSIDLFSDLSINSQNNRNRNISDNKKSSDKLNKEEDSSIVISSEEIINDPETRLSIERESKQILNDDNYNDNLMHYKPKISDESIVISDDEIITECSSVSDSNPIRTDDINLSIFNSNSFLEILKSNQTMNNKFRLNKISNETMCNSTQLYDERQIDKRISENQLKLNKSINELCSTDDDINNIITEDDYDEIGLINESIKHIYDTNLTVSKRQSTSTSQLSWKKTRSDTNLMNSSTKKIFNQTLENKTKTSFRKYPTFLEHEQFSQKSLNKSYEFINDLDDLADNSIDENYVIKTGQITPKKDYELISADDLSTELKKYGLKPLKRRQAIICLEHIYNRTHPFIEFD